MLVNKTKTFSHRTGYRVNAFSGDFSGNSSDSFKHNLGNQLKEEYRKRINILFDEITQQADHILENISFDKFEEYRKLICELINEVLKNAYSLSNEHVLDYSGKQRTFSSINIIDEKLDQLAADIMNSTGDRLDYISRVDEIRGLVTDLLL